MASSSSSSSSSSSPNVIPHNEITKEQFASLLRQYPVLVEAISQAKGAKSGQKTLSELDRYRYVDAAETFDLEKPRREMNLDDVKMLVEWKLRHGKFRPTLMSLVSSNPPSSASQAIQLALKSYASSRDAQSALRLLSELKGVGPATASLLLSVHDPHNVIFFSDEAFYWLCCRGKRAPIKYNPREYLALRTEADALAKRLGVSATDIEKVAYVLMKQQPGGTSKESRAGAPKSAVPTKQSASASPSPPKKRKTASGEESSKAEKRAQDGAAKKHLAGDNASVRRSKRLRK
ncbi:hypothetical protein Trco_002640 [Trichoderma cornu-damae]|uniref:Uncharacterized protein n=1 Tax=Trichoderma cornu-damae TaxID=654480 RepID=A0A9P8TZB4_9HYPO|nr:hypothetical protein Trco_002640 [Trichoderma cornu-damae]